FVLWLMFRRQFRAVAVVIATAAAALSVGAAAYGVGAFNAWLAAIRAVTWTSAWTNASLRALLLRALTRNTSGAAPFATVPDLVAPLFLILAALIVVGTCWVCRGRSVDDSWPAL